jgi:hypothetical protein
VQEIVRIVVGRAGSEAACAALRESKEGNDGGWALVDMETWVRKNGRVEPTFAMDSDTESDRPTAQ